MAARRLDNLARALGARVATVQVDGERAQREARIKKLRRTRAKVDDEAGRGEPIVVFDELGAGEGSRIAVSEGTEAAAPFYPVVKPIDAYNAAILDALEFESL